jgi:hypothetical protein
MEADADEPDAPDPLALLLPLFAPLTPEALLLPPEPPLPLWLAPVPALSLLDCPALPELPALPALPDAPEPLLPPELL